VRGKVLNNRILKNLIYHPAFHSGIKYFGHPYNLVENILTSRKQLALDSSNYRAHTHNEKPFCEFLSNIDLL